MDYLKKLQELAEGIETQEAYRGYYYKVSDVVTIIVIGLLCNLRTTYEIYQWSRAESIRKILSKSFGIHLIPCYAQFMNILGNIKTDSLDAVFMEWCRMLAAGRLKDKTIAIDGKTIRSTTNMKTMDTSI